MLSKKLLYTVLQKWFSVLLIIILIFCLSILSVQNIFAQDCKGVWGCSNFLINGAKVEAVKYTSGEVINCTIHLEISNPPSCKLCRQQIIACITTMDDSVIYSSPCLFDGLPAICPEKSIRDSNFVLTMPKEEGNYKIIAVRTPIYSCYGARTSLQGDRYKTWPKIELVPIVIITSGESIVKQTPNEVTSNGIDNSLGKVLIPIILVVFFLTILILILLFVRKSKKGKSEGTSKRHLHTYELPDSDIKQNGITKPDTDMPLEKYREGYIYIMRNPKYKKDLYKIGWSSNPETRARELNSSTGVVGQYEVLYQLKVNDAPSVERKVFEELASYRTQNNREVFEGEIKICIDTIEKYKT